MALTNFLLTFHLQCEIYSVEIDKRDVLSRVPKLLFEEYAFNMSCFQIDIDRTNFQTV